MISFQGKAWVIFRKIISMHAHLYGCSGRRFGLCVHTRRAHVCVSCGKARGEAGAHVHIYIERESGGGDPNPNPVSALTVILSDNG